MPDSTRRRAGSANTSMLAPTSAKPNTVMPSAMPGKHRRPPLTGHHVLESHRDHAAPFRRRRHHAGPDEAQAGGQQHRPADIDRQLRQHRRDRVGDHVAGEDPEVRRAGDIGGLDISHPADGQHLAAHQPQIDRCVHESDRQHDAADALAEDCDERDREDEDRKGLQHIRRTHDECAERRCARCAAPRSSRPTRRSRCRRRPTARCRARRWSDRRAGQRSRG